MKLLLESTQFQHYKTRTGDLYLSGEITLDTGALVKYLDLGIFPHQIRGNFSLVFVSPKTTIFAVDHYATQSLFYTDQAVGDVFVRVRNSLDNIEADAEIVNFIRQFGGYNISNRTTVQGVLRVEPGTYVKNGQITHYCQIMQASAYEFDPDHFRSLLMSAVSKLAGDKNLIFLSGGKDSSSLLGCMLAADIGDISTVTITSPRQIYSDVDIVRQLDQYYGTNTLYAVTEYSGEILSDQENDRFFSYWRENPFGSKKYVVNNYNFSDHTIFTGEVGPSVYSQTPLVYAAQRPDDLLGVCKYLALHVMTHHKAATTDAGLLGSDHERVIADQAVDYYRTTFERFPETADYFNRLLHIQSVDQSCFRLYSYTQDTAVNWVHPFADWAVVEYLTNIPAKYKLNKQVFRDALSDIISPIPWKFPKNGLSIPAINKY